MSQIPILSIVTWLPAVGALLLLFVRDRAAQRTVALAASLLTLAAAVGALAIFQQAGGAGLREQVGWVPSWGLSYALGADGINIWLVIVAALMMPFALSVARPAERPGANQALLLLLEAGIIGTFLAQDLILFYAFFEFTLIPTALLVGIWGGPERTKAATKFFVYTFAGSVFMLLGIIALSLAYARQAGVPSFDYATLQGLQLGAGEQRLLFLSFFIAFAIKIALWPFHTWMPLLHAQTPADGSVDVAAVLLKVIGGYGMVRFTLGLFPAAAQWAAPAIAALAVVGIIYGGWVAYGQSDMKQVLAYSSVSHLGFVVLGIYALTIQGISGALLQLVNYGLTTGALFLAVGALEGKVGTRQARQLGGLWRVMPGFGGVLLAMALASAGLPGLNGFVGEFSIIQGAWLSGALGWGFVAFAVVGVILAAAYLLTMFKRAFMGPLRPELESVGDMPSDQVTLLGALLIPMVAIGLYPNLVLAPMQPVVAQLAQALGTALGAR